MYLPFWTPKKQLVRRKGGGGGGRGGGSSSGDSGGDSGGSSGGSRGGSSGGSSSSGTRSSVPIGSGSNTGGRTSATSYGSGGGKVSTISSGQLFAGRQQGGGTRNEVFGSRTYGSGYPGNSNPSRGVTGLGFPFFFWPVVWGSAAGGGATYLHDTEYGDRNNGSRPGGALFTVPFSSSSGNTTFHIVADNATATSLLSTVASNCSSVLASNSTGSQSVVALPPFSSSDSTNSSIPQPEQAVQYYRASSVALTLDGYNDTVALNSSAGVNDTHTPLPSWVDANLLDCMNQTIGLAAPLVDGAPSLMAVPFRSASAAGLLWLFVVLANTLL